MVVKPNHFALFKCTQSGDDGVQGTFFKETPTSTWEHCYSLAGWGTNYGKCSSEDLLQCILLLNIHCYCPECRVWVSDAKLTMELGCSKQPLLIGKIETVTSSILPRIMCRVQRIAREVSPFQNFWLWVTLESSVWDISSLLLASYLSEIGPQGKVNRRDFVLILQSSTAIMSLVFPIAY